MTTPLVQRSWPWLAAAGAIVLIFLSTMVEFRSPYAWDTRPPGTAQDIEALSKRSDLNLLFILVDTLRAERLGSYGYERATSPTLDRLAASGVRFARHLAQSSWTKSSMASLWTSLLPQRAGITRFDQVIPAELDLPAERLRNAGFQTIGLWRNGWVAPTFGFDQGFDVYVKPLRAQALPPEVTLKNPTLSDEQTDESVVSAALEFVRLRGDRRWFLYLHLMDVHQYTYDAESAIFGPSYSDIYDSSVLWTDGMLDVLFASLSELGALENTLVVVTSDHGEAFGERGFEGHARRVYREETEIPFYLFFPFQLPSAAVVAGRTSNVDVWPTLFELLGLESGETDGRSRLPEILAAVRGETAAVDGKAPAIAHLDQHWARATTPLTTIAVAEGSQRYVRVKQENGVVVEQLFDSEGDPLERRDHARERPEELARLKSVADAYLEQKPAASVTTREIDELELGHLRALGYAVP